MVMVPVICVVGSSNAGKTTLIERIVSELVKRGYKVGSIKHASHGFEIDHKGKDSWRHSQAGSSSVLIFSSSKLALVKKLSVEPTLNELVQEYFADVDIVLAEGFKEDKQLKIEVFRSDMSNTLISPLNEILFVVSDAPLNLTVPQYDIEDIPTITDVIEKEFLLKSSVTVSTALLRRRES